MRLKFLMPLVGLKTNDMKWVNGYSEDEKDRRRRRDLEECRAKIQRWHRWYAWKPVTISITTEGRQVKVWMQWVVRRAIYSSYTPDLFLNWEYKE